MFLGFLNFVDLVRKSWMVCHRLFFFLKTKKNIGWVRWLNSSYVSRSILRLPAARSRFMSSSKRSARAILDAVYYPGWNSMRFSWSPFCKGTRARITSAFGVWLEHRERSWALAVQIIGPRGRQVANIFTMQNFYIYLSHLR